MPRPKNHILLDMFARTHNEYKMMCHNGKCAGKILSSHSANLERHLKNVHPMLYACYLEQKCDKTRPLATIAFKPKHAISEKSNRANIELAIVEFFTKSGRTWRMIEDRAFKKLVQPAFDAVGISVNEENINYLILAHSEKWKMQTITELQNKLLSLKIDAMSSQGVSVLVTSVQYINHKNVHTKTLAVTDFKLQHTCEHLEAIVLQVLREYEIDVNQIFTITTDSGVVHMTKSVDNGQSGFAMSTDGGDIDANTVEEITKYDCKLMNDKMEMLMQRFCSATVTGVRCGARILQLCVQDVIESPEIQGKLEKLNKVANNLGTLTNGNNNQPAFAESWSSTFNGFETLLKTKNTRDPLNPDSVECDEWVFLNQYTTILSPIHTAIKKLQSEQLCLSDLYIIIMDLLFKVEGQPSGELKTLVAKALTERKDELFDMDLFNAAIYLDPRIKICLNDEQKARAKNYISGLYQRMNSYRENNNEAIIKLQIKQEPSDTSSATHQHLMAKSFSEFLNSLDPCSSQPTTPCLFTDMEPDFKMYERQPRLPLDLNLAQHWSMQNNCLSVIADMLLAVPATQASMERLTTAVMHMSSDQLNSFVLDFNSELNLMANMNGEFIYDD